MKKRVSLLHAALCVAACLGALPMSPTSAAAAAAGAPAAKSTKPAKATVKPDAAAGAGQSNWYQDAMKNPKFRGWVNNQPDTGQFLPDSVWILRVGPRVTTAGDFVREWFASFPAYRPGQDSTGRLTFLSTLLHRDILALTALGQGRKPGFEDRIALRETRQRSLATAVYMRFVNDSVHVAEPEVRELWEAMGWQHRLRHVLLEDRNSADRVYRELIAGKIAWSVAVKRYSVAKHDTGPDGEIGWVTAAKLDPAFTYRVFRMHPGETSQPVQDLDGWHIVQSVERKPIELPSYEGMSGMVREQLRSIRAAEITERLMVKLRNQRGMVYDTATAVFASTRFKETVNVGQEGRGSQINIDASDPEFADADTSRLIARWNGGGRFSIGDLLHTFSDIPPVMRPSLNRWEPLLGFVESVVLEPTIAEYGAEHGLESDPIVTRPMEKKLEELMVEHMYQDSVGTRVWVSKDERKAYYQANLPKFFTYPTVEFAAITRPSKAGADSVERDLRAGRTARDIIAADSAAGLVSGSIQQRNQNEQGPYQKSLFEEMRPGGIQVRGPDRSGDYVVLQLLKYENGHQLTFEESEQMIDESLQNQKSDQALQAMISRLAPRYAIAQRPELLMKIRMVDPTTP